MASTDSRVLIDWELSIRPSSGDGVYIGTANTTGIDENVDIGVPELLWLVLRSCQLLSIRRQLEDDLPPSW